MYNRRCHLEIVQFVIQIFQQHPLDPDLVTAHVGRGAACDGSQVSAAQVATLEKALKAGSLGHHHPGVFRIVEGNIEDQVIPWFSATHRAPSG
jgi:hypothetical protein